MYVSDTRSRLRAFPLRAARLLCSSCMPLISAGVVANLAGEKLEKNTAKASAQWWNLFLHKTKR